MRAAFSFMVGMWLAAFGAAALAGGTDYVPPPASGGGGGGGVSGDGTGVTDASAFRTALSLGTAATVNTGTSSGNVPLLTTGGLPAVGGGNLTGISSSQVSGLGTASGYAATSFLQVANDLSDVTPSTARTNLGLGTAATADTGIGSGNVPVLGIGGTLPAVNASLLTGITASQVSGLGTASAASTGDFVAASGFYAPDTWTYTWAPSDGDPIAANGFTAVQSASTAYDPTTYGIPCYTVTPFGASGESSIYKNVGAASASSWEVRVLLWGASGGTSRFGWMYDSGIGTTDALYKVTTSSTTTPLRVNEATVSVPALQYSGRWVMWTLRCWYNLSTTQTCELYAGRIKLYTFESAIADSAVSAGRFTVGRTIGAVTVSGCLGGIWVRSDGINESPVEYRERARQF